MFFEHILKMALTGEAQVAADLPQGFIRIAEQGFCFSQAALRNAGPNIRTQLLLKFFEKICPAFSGVGHYIGYADGLIHMDEDKLHAGINFLRNTGRELLL